MIIIDNDMIITWCKRLNANPIDREDRKLLILINMKIGNVEVFKGIFGTSQSS